MNPLALGLMIFGGVLLLFGITSLVKRRKTMGLVLSLFGFIAIVTPFVVSYSLAR